MQNAIGPENDGFFLDRQHEIPYNIWVLSGCGEACLAAVVPSGTYSRFVPKRSFGSIAVARHLGDGTTQIWRSKNLRVWRSLVSRLVRVQEASGSNPDTPTKAPKATAFGAFLIIVKGFCYD